MFGKSVKCDICGTTEMIPEMSDHGFDGFGGWIRVMVNKPPLYSFSRDKERSTLTASFDACSILCAQKAIRMAEEVITDGTDG